MDVSNLKLEFYSRPARKFWTFWRIFTDVKTSVWALTETLVVDRGKNKFNFSRHFRKFRFFQAISHKKIDFFPGKFSKNFDFFRQFNKKFDFPGKNWSFTATYEQ